MPRSLFLSGGGARGAYQVGVLLGIQEITQAGRLPFDILSSVSAGSINAAFLAMYVDDFRVGVNKLADIWTSLSCEKVYRAGNLALIESVIRNLVNMLFHIRIPGGQYLLDTAPLKKLLERELDFRKINNNVDTGALKAFEVSSICYEMAGTISFFCSSEPHEGWRRTRHFGYPTQIECSHILASSAIPLFFPAVKIDNLHYGDGGMRQANPLRASIELGANSILIIGTKKESPFLDPRDLHSMGDVTFARILGTMFNTLFLDNVERDLDILIKINANLELTCVPEKESIWRKINVLYINPSVDLGKLATDKIKVMSLLMRYLMNAFGQKEQAGDFLSFLLFEAEYCKELIKIGYQDALKQKNEIVKFFAV